MTTTETPAQRRTRLIEQYAAIVSGVTTPIRLANAIELADAVIAATPQEPPAPSKFWGSDSNQPQRDLINQCLDAEGLMKQSIDEGIRVSPGGLSIWLKSWELLKRDIGVK
jgi:hypothetical protein